ncbi:MULTISPECIES: IS3 family transposase [Alicyclobacillus]|uniref:IS3 family transposase n=1 Tax=Alicyclobacillus TaxID=29330 RepID=UPI00210416A9|nr:MULTISPECIES: IS3 family transposase [Alicyclobacillus]MCY0870766.1 IS3 family transposase [Bacillota bacterium]
MVLTNISRSAACTSSVDFRSFSLINCFKNSFETFVILVLSQSADHVRELGVYTKYFTTSEKFKTRQQAIHRIFEYIEVWYNRERVHSSIGYLTPVEYERRYFQVSRSKAS